MAASAVPHGDEHIAAKAPQEASERVEPCAFTAIRYGGLPKRRISPRRSGPCRCDDPCAVLRDRRLRGIARLLERRSGGDVYLPCARAFRAHATLLPHHELHSALHG